MYIVKVDGMVVKLCHSFAEAKRYKGKIYKLAETKLPKVAMVSFNSSKAAKREIYKEIYSEKNHGYHFIQRKGGY